MRTTIRLGGGFLSETGPFRWSNVIRVPIQLPQMIQFHLFGMAIEETNVRRSGQALRREPALRQGVSGLAVPRDGHNGHGTVMAESWDRFE